MKFFKLLALPVLLVIVHCSSRGIRVNVVNSMPGNFMETMQGGRNVGIYTIESKVYNDRGREKIIQGQLENAFRQAGYFNVIDISSRDTRLKEMERSQTGLTDAEIQLGREMALNGLLYLEVIGEPVSQCKTSTKKVRKKKCPTCIPEDVTVEVKTVEYRIPMRGKLVNVETGKSIVYTQNDAIPLSSNVDENPTCPAESDAFANAAFKSATKLARQLSPYMAVINVEIGDDALGADKSVEDQVEAALKEGNKWARANPPNIPEAKKNWQSALSISNGTAIYAIWNLAVAAWSEGNLDEADAKFAKAQSAGGSKFMNSDKVNIVNKFKAEQQRTNAERKYRGR
jgi:hypothetical protein